MGSCCSRDDPVVNLTANHLHVERVATGHNKPLKDFNVKWKSENLMTKEALLRQRDAFWDTSPTYSGRTEVWAALRLACESDSMGTAQAILDSAGITVPTGSLCDGCYDELGAQYTVPKYCYSRPSNLTDDSQLNASPNVSTLSSLPQLPQIQIEDVDETLSIKVRMSSSGIDIPIIVRPGDTIESLKNRIRAPRSTVVFFGKVLANSTLLKSANIVNKSVVQVFETT